MKLRLISDLHAEFGFDKALLNSSDADVLVIAGDLHVGADNTWTLLKQFADYVPNVVFVAGNHEYYRQNMQVTNQKLKEFSEGTSIKVLDAETVWFDPKLGKLVPKAQVCAVEPIAIIGASLWTNFRENPMAEEAAKIGINDFRLIEYGNGYFSPANAKSIYYNHFNYIKHMVEETKKRVIVTHFLPAVECIAKQFQGPNLLNYYFANDLGGFISELEDTTWLFGHTHDSVDVTIGSTRILANPYGYGKNNNYKELFINV